jgi:hypothetical protein
MRLQVFRRCSLSLLLLALPILPGCGGGGSDSPAPSQAPVIGSFTATPAAITTGQSTTLAWSVTGATSLSISPGLGAVLGTSTVVGPTVTTTYTLTAVNAGGSVSATATVTVGAAPNILQALQGTAGVTAVTEKATSISGARFFVVTFTQPVDHHAPSGPTFSQKLTLLFRSFAAPMVLATTGYSISQNPGQGEPTVLLAANQLAMEYRYFDTSTPAALDWTKLDIWQAATDEHRVVAAFKPLFSGKWLNTGGSKGGMTALFHRRFYPSDVDATLAYVAPINQGNPDPRYIPFVDGRGTPATRAALEAWQQAILDRRAELLGLLNADAAAKGSTLQSLGADRTLEFAVLEAPFTLWQYRSAALAAQTPPPTATPQQLYAFLDAIYGGVVYAWDDATLDYYQAYYYQCGTQLGYPAVKYSHLNGLLYPGQDVPQSYPPLGVLETWDGGAAMADILAWVGSSATRLLLVYGENDPWTTGAVPLSAAAQARDNHAYVVPLGNHGSRLSQLPQTQRNEAYGLLSGWMGVPVQPVPAASAEFALSTEAIEEGTFVVGRKRGSSGRR